MDEKQKNVPFKTPKKGVKAERRKKRDFEKKSGQDKAGYVSSVKHKNLKAFAITKVQKTERLLQRTQDKRAQKIHLPQSSDDVAIKLGEAAIPPSIVAVVGANGVGKTTVLLGLIRNLTKRNVNAKVEDSNDSTSSSLKGPITVTLGTKSRVTFIECAPDLNCMADVAKIADVVVLVIHANRGFEMETLEILHLLKSHGMPRVVGVVTHNDEVKVDNTGKLWMKKLKRRFQQEVKEKYIRMSKFSPRTLSYNPFDLQTLGRCVVEKLARITDWRREHAFLLADFYEDLTSVQNKIQNPKTDRQVAFYGYIRGTKLIPNSSIHIPGVGDYVIDKIDRVDDPCPVLPKKTQRDENGKRIRGTRGQRLRQRKIFAPLSGIGNAIYLNAADGNALIDMNAVHANATTINDNDNQHHQLSSSKSIDLQMLGNRMREGLEKKHQMQIFDDDQLFLPAQQSEEDEDDDSSSEEEDEADEDEDISSSEQSNDEDDEPMEVDQQNLADLFAAAENDWDSLPGHADLNRIVYDSNDDGDNFDDETSTNPNDGLNGLFVSTTRNPGFWHEHLIKSDIHDSNHHANENRLEELKKSVKSRFAVSANWKKDEISDDNSNEDSDDEDDDDEKSKPINKVQEKKARKRNRNAAIYNIPLNNNNNNASTNNKSNSLAKRFRKSNGIVDDANDVDEEEGTESNKTKAPEAPVNGLLSEGVSKFYQAVHEAVTKQSDFNEHALAHLSEDKKAEIEGFQQGVYVRVIVNGIPMEFIEYFDASYPIILGSVKSREQEKMLVHASYHPHRWFPRQIRCGDPLIISCGWRRYQTRPIFCRKGDDGRLIMMKYSPPQVACFITFYGFVVPEKTGFVAFQTSSKKEMNFRMCGSGAILHTDQEIIVQKRLRLRGEPFLCKGKTAFIRGMFGSSAEVVQNAGADLMTPAGIRGQIKKPVQRVRSGGGGKEYMQCQEGDFRATFEHGIDRSHLVYLKTWVKYPIDRLLIPVDNLCLASTARDEWQVMRTLTETRKAMGLPSLAESAEKGFYESIERKPFLPKDLRIPAKLEANLPFLFKTKLDPTGRKIASSSLKKSSLLGQNTTTKGDENENNFIADLNLPEDVEVSQQKRRERLLAELTLIGRNLMSNKRDKMRKRGEDHQKGIAKKIAAAELKKKNKNN